MYHNGLLVPHPLSVPLLQSNTCPPSPRLPPALTHLRAPRHQQPSTIQLPKPTLLPTLPHQQNPHCPLQATHAGAHITTQGVLTDKALEGPTKHQGTPRSICASLSLKATNIHYSTSRVPARLLLLLLKLVQPKQQLLVVALQLLVVALQLCNGVLQRLVVLLLLSQH